MKILLIKTSSMGDLIHCLPAITDAKKNRSDLSFDWLVEPGFAEIPTWHPAVNKVISLSLRDLRKNMFSLNLYKKLISSIKKIRETKYDLIIDAQGLFKSAIFAKIARAKETVGLDYKSARENLASLFYTKKINVSWEMHAVTRLRTLFAKSLNYKYDDTELHYGIDLSYINTFNNNNNIVSNFNLPNPYIFLLHGTTWATKHWPDNYWVDLAIKFEKQGIYTCATWVNDTQLKRLQNIKNKVKNFTILPKLTLTQAAFILQQAKAAIAVDTGFGHLAAAVNTPLISLYGPTDPKQVGTLGTIQELITSNIHCSPCRARNCINQSEYIGCMKSITPDVVWDKYSKLI